MRSPIWIAALLLAAAPQAGQAFADDYSRSRDALPRDEQSLQRLNTEQLRIVRRALHECDQRIGHVAINPKRNPCVIIAADKAVADTEDPELQAFHAVLHDNERYDEYRSDAAASI